MKNPTTCPRCGIQLPASAEAGTPCPRCLMQLGFEESSPRSPAFEVPDFEEVVRTFPQLEILEHVGTGGMGVVYHARQKGLDRDVALKLVSVGVTADPAFAERFTREARALASLEHPAITSVYDFGQVGGFYYLVMEYVDGANLRQVLNTGGLSPREAMTLVARMCDALQYAHDHGIVHRDIKPENLLLDRKGQLKIIDFGLAKMLGQAPAVAGLTRTDQAMGTWHYMAPEQVERPLEVDHRADIYSLGVVFYELLTGELPLGRFSPPSERGDMDVRLDKIVMRTLEKEPDARYQKAGQVKTDLDHVSHSKGAPQLAAAHAPEPPKREERGSRFGVFSMIFGCLGIMMLFGCLGAFLLLFAGEEETPTAFTYPIDGGSPGADGAFVQPFTYSIDGGSAETVPEPRPDEATPTWAEGSTPLRADDSPPTWAEGYEDAVLREASGETEAADRPGESAPEGEVLEDPEASGGELAPEPKADAAPASPPAEQAVEESEPEEQPAAGSDSVR